MKNQHSDDRLDATLQRILRDASVDDATIDEIADSPAIWWGVQKKVLGHRASPWPPVEKYLRWVFVLTPVTAAVVIAAIFFFGGSTPNDVPVAVNTELPAVAKAELPAPAITLPESIKANDDNSVTTAKPVRAVRLEKAVKRSLPKTRVAANFKRTNEIKTEFISLTYAQNPTSGQVVRVKVPSSMMVSLGLVPSVEKPQNLVDAEVVVGDDGMTHAIRFIRGQ